VDGRQVNRRVLESLIKAGALDAFGGRAALLAGLDGAIDYGQQIIQERELGQTSLFGGEGAGHMPPPALPGVPASSASARLAQEKEAIGVYISGHPLADKAQELARRTTSTLAALREGAEEELVTVGGVITVSRRVVTKAGDQMLIARLEDLSGSIETVVFPKWYAEMAPVLSADAIVVIRGRVKERRAPGKPAVVTPSEEHGDEEPVELSLQAIEVWPLAKAPVIAAHTSALIIALQSSANAVPSSTNAVPGSRAREIAANGATSEELALKSAASGPTLKSAGLHHPDALHVRMIGDTDDATRLTKLRALVLAAGGGDGRIVLHAASNEESRPLQRPLLITGELRSELAELFGPDNVWLGAA
jgi:hypothetical protein